MTWLTPATTPAADSTWVGPGGGVYSGTFQAAVNWSTGVPGPLDTATFDLGQTYTVWFAGAATNEAVIVGGGGNATFRTGPSGNNLTYSVGSASVLDGARWDIQHLNLDVTGVLRADANGWLRLGNDGGQVRVNADTVEIATGGIPGQTGRVSVFGSSSNLSARLIRLGNAANVSGTAIGQLTLDSFTTVGTASAGVNLDVERGGYVKVQGSGKLFVGASLNVSGGTYEQLDSASTTSFQPDSVVTVENGGSASFGRTRFVGGSMTARGAGTKLTITGDVGSVGGSVVDISDGAAATFYAGTADVSVGGGATAPAGHGTIRLSGGAIGTAVNVQVGGLADSEGHLVVTGPGTKLTSPVNNYGVVTVGTSTASIATVEVSNGAVLNGHQVLVYPTGTLTIDHATVLVDAPGAVDVIGGSLRLVNGGVLQSVIGGLRLNAGGVATLASGTVVAKVAVAGGSSLEVSGPVDLTQAEISATDGTFRAQTPTIAPRNLQLLDGASFVGDATVTTQTTFELTGATLGGAGDVFVGGSFDSGGTNTARITGARRITTSNLGGGRWVGAHDIVLGPDAVIVNRSSNALNADAGVRLLGGRFDNLAAGRFGWVASGTSSTAYTAMFNNDGGVTLVDQFMNGIPSGTLAFNGGGTHSGFFTVFPANAQMGYRFGGGNHLFQPQSRIIAPRVAFDGDVRATLLGKVTATASLTVGGTADVSAGAGARFDLGAAKLIVAEDATLHLNTGAGVTVGSLAISDRGRLDTADDLTVTGAFDLLGGTVTILPGAAPRVLRSGGFNAPPAGAGRLDLTRNGMIVDYDGASPVADVAAAVVRGYHGGGWDGPGITSADAAAAPSRYAVGYAEANTVLAPGQTFLGRPVDDTAVLVRFTLSGDATLDGVVDFGDLVAVAQNYNSGNPIGDPRRWREGDFNYDGVVDFNDLVRLAQNYNAALPASGVGIPGASAAFQSDLAAALAAVPEPSTAVAGVASGALFHLTRRRRRRNLAPSA